VSPMSDDAHDGVERIREAFDELSIRHQVGLGLLAVVLLIGLVGVLFPNSAIGGAVAFTASILVLSAQLATTSSVLASALRLSVPICFAALGGIFSEKSGVINIGLEGLLIISAFTAIYAADLTGSTLQGYLLGVLSSVVLAAVFAVVVIEFRADQIIAGLAVWLIALGLAPFASKVVYGGPNTDSVATPPTVTDLTSGIPGVAGVLETLSGIPFFGALFDASLSVYLMLIAVVVSWYALNRTTFGRWIRASGENPDALDTAGINVSRIRYAGVLVSGVFAGMGGAALSLDLSQFTGNGPTMVNGKGFIAIVAYLFGNYNPVGAFLSTLLFAGLDALQNALQLQNIGVPNQLIRVTPFVTVIIVLAFVGRTRLPDAAGEHFESGEE
jgi:simple sugar transport system permease protein